MDRRLGEVQIPVWRRSWCHKGNQSLAQIAPRSGPMSVVSWVAVAFHRESVRNFSASPWQWQHRTGWLRPRQRNCWSYEVLWTSFCRAAQSSSLSVAMELGKLEATFAFQQKREITMTLHRHQGRSVWLGRRCHVTLLGLKMYDDILRAPRVCRQTLQQLLDDQMLRLASRI